MSWSSSIFKKFEEYHPIYNFTTTSISLFSNSLLLFIIFTTSSTQIGAYRYLLAVFAICDIMTSINHAFCSPIVHLTTSGVYGISRNAGKMVVYGVSLDAAIWAMFIVAFFQTFLILSYHFVYRYKTTTRLIHATCTDKWKVSHWTCLCVLMYAIDIGIYLTIDVLVFTPDQWTRDNAPAEILKIYDVNLRNPNVGFLTVLLKRPCSDNSHRLCWHWRTLEGTAVAVSLLIATVAVIVYCIKETIAAMRLHPVQVAFELAYIRATNNVMSAKTRRMQRQLFNALLIQTAIPCIFSYTPLAILLLLMLSGVSLGESGNIVFATTSIFPAIDSFFILYFIIQFRVAVVRLFRLPFYSSEQEVSSSQKNFKSNTVHTNTRSVQPGNGRFVT